MTDQNNGDKPKSPNSNNLVEIKPPPSEVSDKEVLIFIGGLFGLFTAFVGTMTWWENKKERERREENLRILEERKQKRRETEEWINDLQNSGKTVFTLKDGRYLAVPTDSKFETHIRES